MAFVSLKELKELQYRVVVYTLDLHLIGLGSGACFLKVLKLLGSILSDIILSLSSKGRHPKAQNFAVILIIN